MTGREGTNRRWTKSKPVKYLEESDPSTLPSSWPGLTRPSKHLPSAAGCPAQSPNLDPGTGMTIRVTSNEVWFEMTTSQQDVNMMDYEKIGEISVAKVLHDFVSGEVLPGT